MIGRGVTIVVGIALIAAVVLAFGSARGESFGPAVLVAAALYLVSHLLRCARLALLAVPILGLSGRTAMLLHLYTAPVAFATPLKLGELFRIQQFWAASGRFLPTLVMVVVERSLDAVCLLAVCALLIAAGGTATEKLVELTLLLLLATIAAGFVLIVAPSALRRLQSYILLRHIERRARILLSTIDKLRELAQLGADCLARNAAPLVFVSGLIWMAEIAAMIALLPERPGMVGAGAAAAIERVGSEWRWLFWDGGGQTVARTASLISFAVLIGLWPVVAILLERRLAVPPADVSPRILTGGH